ncbi:MAG: hypothetical protein ACYCT7_09345 [bacterium]
MKNKVEVYKKENGKEPAKTRKQELDTALRYMENYKRRLKNE